MYMYIYILKRRQQPLEAQHTLNTCTQLNPPPTTTKDTLTYRKPSC